MKTLVDGTQVSSSSYYYLLDFNDRDGWNLLQSEFGKMKLSALDITEYTELFRIITEKELVELKNK